MMAVTEYTYVAGMEQLKLSTSYSNQHNGHSIPNPLQHQGHETPPDEEIEVP